MKERHYMKTNSSNSNNSTTTLFTLDTPVYYYKLRNGEELISVEEDVGHYASSMLETIEKSPQMTEKEKKGLKAEIRKEIKDQMKTFKNSHVELHYPMRVATFPVSGGQGALHLNFWVSPSIYPSQIVHMPKDEVLIRLPVAASVTSYYFSIVRKYILMYAKNLVSQGQPTTDYDNELISNMEEQLEAEEFLASEAEDFIEPSSQRDDPREIFSKDSKEENHNVPKVKLGNGLKKTLH